jgi:hypothetical protein
MHSQALSNVIGTFIKGLPVVLGLPAIVVIKACQYNPDAGSAILFHLHVVRQVDASISTCGNRIEAR